MTSRRSSHADRALPVAPRPPAAPPKLQVQGLLSKDTITIHFSALGKEEEDEEEDLYGLASSTTAPAPPADQPSVVTALEASEDMFGGMPLDSPDEGAALPESSSSPSPVAGSQAASLSSLPSGHKSYTAFMGPNPTSPPSKSTKSVSLPSMDKPFFGLVKSLSSDVEPREGAAPAGPSVRHRHLMKSFVKSLSSDTSQDSSSPYRLPDSRLNLQLFKQFTQSRNPAAATAAAASTSDSKTAPSSPLSSPDSRSFFVTEVEARIEDTKRRLSEVIYEPLQMLSKMMGDESGGGAGGGSGIYRPKVLSSSASELSGLASVNSGLLEHNNNSYCIKEEEGGDWEADSPVTAASGPAESPGPPTADPKSPGRTSSGGMALALDKFSMSALARQQEDEDYCILSSEDFETGTDTEGNGADRSDGTGAGGRRKAAASGSTEPRSDDEWEQSEELEPSVPHYTLAVLTALVYGYFVLPMPAYVGGLLLGVGLGFLLAIGVVWWAGPKPSGRAAPRVRYQQELWNMAQLDIREPDIFKGWMNEIVNYDPETYHATLTHSVFVRLEGSVLRLSKPNRNIPRRATHNEAKPDVTYISQKIYDLTDSKICLAPQSLARKRVWNKKYPICIELARQDHFMSKAEGEAGDECAATPTAPGEGAGSQDGGRPPPSRDPTLYLFGRTGREKEEWFRRILLASKPRLETRRPTSAVGSKDVLKGHSRNSSRGSLDETLASLSRTRDSSPAGAGGGGARPKPLLDYGVYMASLLPPQAASPTTTLPVLQPSPQSSPGVGKKLPSSPVVQRPQEEEAVAWVNAALGRVLWDFLGEPHWAELVSKKIQMKLSKIRLPYFMNELTLTELDMGVATPRILGASHPSVDHQGLWFDLEMCYSGSFLMTLETKMNLIRLGKEGEGLRVGEFGKDGYRPRSYCLADSDEESSSAGSSDEEDTSEVTADAFGAEGLVGGHKPSKIMRFVDKIAKSKYFQKATETEFIKKKMEEVSNTPLLLTVEVQELRGTLAVNIPPPPTDRIWYGFRSPPHLELKARPKLGERVVTLAHVTDWIEKKLDQEFQKILVMPNMDDVWLTVMHSALDPRTSGAPPPSSVTPDPEASQPEGGATGPT
ncbi:testis-expressed protein 2-like [Aplochiton taeniatus]